MRVVQLLSGQDHPLVTAQNISCISISASQPGCHPPDEVSVEPEEEGAVIVAPGHAGRGAVEHELGVPVHPGSGHQVNTHLAQKVVKRMP